MQARPATASKRRRIGWVGMAVMILRGVVPAGVGAIGLEVVAWSRRWCGTRIADDLGVVDR